MNHEIIVTADGSHTLFLPEMNEQYHSVNGAIAESNHVFIKNGYHFHKKANPVIFEVGFGTGLNCLLTALEAIKQKRFTRYISVEKFPLDEKIIYQLNYGKLISKKASELYNKIHEANWNEWKSISKYFQLKKIETDIIEMNFLDLEKFDIIYFDAFAPEKQPEMWKPQVFRKIHQHCLPNAVFTTYSAKGEVRRQLNIAGFDMERLPGPPGKKQILRGIKGS